MRVTSSSMVLAISLLFVTPQLSAYWGTGNDLKDQCSRAGNDPFKGVCYGYVSGVTDSWEGGLFCIPTGVQRSQLVEVVKKYLDENPGKLHESGSTLVINALRMSFPCKR